MENWFLTFSFHFISQFYSRAHNAKAFLKCAPLDSVRSLVRMLWFDQAPGRTWTRDCSMESENLPLSQGAWLRDFIRYSMNFVVSYSSGKYQHFSTTFFFSCFWGYSLFPHCERHCIVALKYFAQYTFIFHRQLI